MRNKISKSKQPGFQTWSFTSKGCTKINYIFIESMLRIATRLMKVAILQWAGITNQQAEMINST